jgi:hypothetical protein
MENASRIFQEAGRASVSIFISVNPAEVPHAMAS